MDQDGKNLEIIHSLNRKLILKLIQKNGICSRSELAKQSGLKNATITNNIKTLMQLGLVDETGMIEGKKGRRSIGLKISGSGYAVISIRLTRKYFQVGMFSVAGEKIEELEKVHYQDTSPKMVLSDIRNKVCSLMDLNDGQKILAIGVAVPGPYYYKEGIIESISDFPGWTKVNIREELQNKFDIPVVVEHDAKAGVLAECSLAVDPGSYETVVYLALGQGIGAGIYQHGEVFHGADGIAGEIGHATIDINGPECECGNRGCLTLYASTLAFQKRMQRKYEECYPKMPREDITFEFLLSKINHKDEFVCKEFKETMRYLSVGVINLIYNFNPGLIIIGDEMSKAGNMILEEMNDYIQNIVDQRIIGKVKLQLTSFVDDPAYVGAAVLAIDYIFENTDIMEEFGSD